MSTTRDVIWRGLAGASAGVVGAVAMTVPIYAAKALGVIHEPPPKQIARHAANQTGTSPHLTHEEFTIGWLLAHLGYGAASGVAFAFLRPYVPLNGTISGVLYGTFLWAVGYLGVMPALGLYPLWKGASKHIVAVMLPSHWLYGAVSAEVLEKVGPHPLGVRLVRH